MNKIILFLFLVLLFKAEAQNASALTVSKKADSLFEIGVYNKAIPYFLEAKRYREVARSYEAIGNNSKARKYFQKALFKNKENPKTQFEYVKLLVKLSRYKEADSVLQNLQSRFPDNSNFVYKRGLIKEAQNDSTAIEYYKQVYLLDTNHINSTYKIARNHIENRKFVESEAYINKGLVADSTSIRFLNLLALKQFYTKDYHEAIVTYSKLIIRGAGNIQIHENLASCYSNTYQFEKALHQFEILLTEYDDKNAKWHLEIAGLYRSLKEYKKAERHLNIAIALQEIPLSKSYMGLAKVFKAQKDYKNEMEALKSALSNNPNNEMALYSMAIAADNYFADKKLVLGYYEAYLRKYAENGKMRNLAKHRVADLKNELHFTTD
ncbi:tetratricopeptide repeat protein [Aequorivita marina]|uniref:tetratricopeptide repeat protein n=1 Tax=Aequorivita marina TaxID=3073654 RepID=UPI0028750EBB|nr:tetratricopeptide repeat protein [Aequorivita sp. S2608]MDS1299744.1 tetratricopeptide repeat protein [Aequorivita sp. S2608]